MGGYFITPNEKWTIAASATVTLDSDSYPNVPIIRIYDTPAKLTISDELYEDGVIILNEVDPPDDTNGVPKEYGQGFVKGKKKVEIETGGEWPNRLTLAMFKP
jgi:hypothetical protein